MPIRSSNGWGLWILSSPKHVYALSCQPRNKFTRYPVIPETRLRVILSSPKHVYVLSCHPRNTFTCYRGSHNKATEFPVLRTLCVLDREDTDKRHGAMASSKHNALSCHPQNMFTRYPVIPETSLRVNLSSPKQVYALTCHPRNTFTCYRGSDKKQPSSRFCAHFVCLTGKTRKSS